MGPPGQVLAVLELAVDESLAEAGLARELVNRFQKLRKKAGLTVEDTVELYCEPVSELSCSGGGGYAVSCGDLSVLGFFRGEGASVLAGSLACALAGRCKALVL